MWHCLHVNRRTLGSILCPCITKSLHLQLASLPIAPTPQPWFLEFLQCSWKKKWGKAEVITPNTKQCTLQQLCNNFSQAFPIMIIFSGIPRPWDLFITAAGWELLYCSSTSLGWVLLMKQPCDQTEIMLEEACIIRPAFNYCDIWPAAAALPSSPLSDLRREDNSRAPLQKAEQSQMFDGERFKKDPCIDSRKLCDLLKMKCLLKLKSTL